jgi:hypothetical protein
MGNLRYLCSALFFLSGLPILWFGLSSSSLDSALLGGLGVAVSFGIVLPQHVPWRYLCAAIFVVNGVLFLQGATSSGSPIWLIPAALSFAAAIAVVRRQGWVWIAALIAGSLEVGTWAVVVLHDAPQGGIEAAIISLLPGLLFSAVWIWCIFASVRISRQGNAPKQT